VTCIVAVAAIVLLGAGDGGAGNGQIDVAKAIKVKAAVLLNFCRFIEWPEKAFAKKDSPFVIGVVGEDPFGPVLDTTMEGKSVGAHPIVVKRFAANSTPAQLAECSMLFISASEEQGNRHEQHCDAVADKPVLTVSDIPGFAVGGGMIEVGFVGGKASFSVNRKGAEGVGLSLSSKLLQLGNIVEPKRKPGHK